MIRKTMLKTVLFSLFLMAMPATGKAQTVTVNGQVYEKKVVRRLLIDREDITVVMNDGSAIGNVTQLQTLIDKTAGINETWQQNEQKPSKGDGIYDLSGRKLDAVGEAQLRRGIYIKRTSGKNKKWTKH